MHFIVYKTTNKINGKIYIGVHKTDNLNDMYIGSGRRIIKAINYYGAENFVREIIADFDNAQDMFDLEQKIVNANFVNDSNTYNLKIGGEGGWSYVNGKHMTAERKKNISLGLSKAHREGRHHQQFTFSMLSSDRHREISSKGGKAAGGLNRLSENEIYRRKSLLKDIDFSIRGSLNKAAQVLQVSHTQARRFLKQHLPDALR